MLDLETIKVKNDQIVISISFSYLFEGKIKTIFELIDHNQLLENRDKAIRSLWLNFMNKLNNLKLNKWKKLDLILIKLTNILRVDYNLI